LPSTAHPKEFMTWLHAKLYDCVMSAPEEACLRSWRTEVLEQTRGCVLEVGAGTGVNLPLYPASIDRLVASEPDPYMRAQLQRKGAIGPHMEVSADCLGQLEQPSESFDFVVSTLVLCSVADPAAALADIHRVLKPGGKLLFLEHVRASNDPGRLKWQRRVEPFWKVFAGNCHVTRDTERRIETSGFSFESITRESMRKAPPWVRPTIRGVAVKTAS
jgi:SAM-dependent methyltransferase